MRDESSQGSSYQHARARLEAALMDEESTPGAYQEEPILLVACDVLRCARQRFWQDPRWFALATDAVSVARSVHAQIGSGDAGLGWRERFILQRSHCAIAGWALVLSRFAFGARKGRLRQEATDDLRRALDLTGDLYDHSSAYPL
jgi:hypothetical protein